MCTFFGGISQAFLDSRIPFARYEENPITSRWYDSQFQNFEILSSVCVKTYQSMTLIKYFYRDVEHDLTHLRSRRERPKPSRKVSPAFNVGPSGSDPGRQITRSTMVYSLTQVHQWVS